MAHYDISDEARERAANSPGFQTVPDSVIMEARRDAEDAEEDEETVEKADGPDFP